MTLKESLHKTKVKIPNDQTMEFEEQDIWDVMYSSLMSAVAITADQKSSKLTERLEFFKVSFATISRFLNEEPRNLLWEDCIELQNAMAFMIAEYEDRADQLLNMQTKPTDAKARDWSRLIVQVNNDLRTASTLASGRFAILPSTAQIEEETGQGLVGARESIFKVNNFCLELSLAYREVAGKIEAIAKEHGLKLRGASLRMESSTV